MRQRFEKINHPGLANQLQGMGYRLGQTFFRNLYLLTGLFGRWGEGFADDSRRAFNANLAGVKSYRLAAAPYFRLLVGCCDHVGERSPADCGNFLLHR